MTENFNPFKFDEKLEEEERGDNRKENKKRSGADVAKEVVKYGLWTISALLSFSFGAQWLAPVFINLFSWAPPIAAKTIAAVAGGMFVAFTFDIGALTALFVQDYSAKTVDQQEIANRVKWVDFAGSLVATVAQIFFYIPAEMVTVPAEVKNLIGWTILVVTIAVFCFNLYQSIRYHEASPETIKAKHEAEQFADALKRRHTRDIAASKLARTMAKAETDAELETLEQANILYHDERKAIAPELARRKAARLQKKLLIREGLLNETTQQDTPAPLLTHTEQEAPALLAAESPYKGTVSTQPAGTADSKGTISGGKISPAIEANINEPTDEQNAFMGWVIDEIEENTTPQETGDPAVNFPPAPK